MALGKASQDFVPIKEIRDNIIVLKDGSLRAVVMVSSINFSLKGEDEKKSILFQFQDFLNSLDFTIQIFLQSRRFDIRPYVALLEGRLREQMSDLMKIQIQEYINFVRKFTEQNNIMTKNFFVVIPYSPAIIQGGKGVSGIVGNITGKKSTADIKASFDENITQLEQRVSVVEQGLTRCGLRVAQLGTEEITELFYKLFNPGETEKPIQ